MSLHQCFSTMRLQPVGDIPGLRKVRPWILLPWILKTRTCWKQRAPLHRTESSLHWLWRLLLVWLSRLFPPLIPFSVMLDISFFERQFMKSSLIPRMSITDIWRAKLPAAKCQVSHVQKKKKKNVLCNSELSGTKKRERDVWCDDWSFVSPRAATTLERSPRAIGHLSEATVAATVQKVKGKVNDVGRHKPVFPCLGWMPFVFFGFLFFTDVHVATRPELCGAKCHDDL